MQKPRIGFNIFPYRSARSGGMFYYALNMLREFARKVPERLTLFYGRHSRMLIRGIDGLEEITRRQIGEPSDIFDHRHEFDVLFTPAVWGGVTMLDYPTIHVIPDIQEQYYPEFFSADDLRHRRIVHPWVSRSSTLLITISNFSKYTIMEKFGIPTEKVRVTHLAAHPIFSDEFEKGIRPPNMPDEKEFLFYPANSWNHKNHRSILDALVELRSRYGLRVPAILSGHLLKGDFNCYDTLTEIRARKLEDQVFHMGRIDLHALKYLYLNAAALIHPSLFEGFGIPLVEAMSSGCPVIAARATSIPEICGESALYFDPHNPLDIAQKIKHFFENPAEADTRRELGMETAHQYSDDKTASETIEIIDEAYRLVAGERVAGQRICNCSAHLRSPVLSLFISAGAVHPNGTCSELARLRSEAPDLVQLICVCTDATKNCCKTDLCLECVSLDGSGDMKEVLSRAVEVAKGRYFFFAEGGSVPDLSFICHLAAKDLEGVVGEMLHGDSYLKDPKSGRIRAWMTLAEDDSDAVKDACCLTLSFVVRSDAFRRFLSESGDRWSSFQQMGLLLWPHCERQRVYGIVNSITTPAWNLYELWEKLRGRVRPGTVLGRFLGTRIGRSMTIQMLRVYRSTPYPIKEVVRSAWRATRG